MKMDVHDEHGDTVELEITLMDVMPQQWTFRYVFGNHFETVVKLDRYELKALVSWLTASL